MIQDINKHQATEGNIPKYEQARRQLLKYISALPADAEYLPFEYELVEMFGISRVCIRRALAELRKEGIIQTVRNRGSKVLRRDFNQSGGNARLDLANTQVAAIFPADTQEGKPTDFYPWRIAGQLEHVIQARGGSMEYINLRRSKKDSLSPEEAVKHVIERGIRWVLIIYHYSINMNSLIKPLLANSVKPLVFFNSLQAMQQNSEAMYQGIDFIAENQNQMIYETLVTRFNDCDYIAALANSENMTWAKFRCEPLEKFADNFGIEYEFFVDNIPRESKQDSFHINRSYSKISGSKLVDSILPNLKAAKRPLIFGANDCFALGALERLQKIGLRCPEDVEILGFDNMAEAQAGNLSTFANNAEAVANTAFKSLSRFLEDPQTSLDDGIGRFTVPVFCDRNTTK